MRKANLPDIVGAYSDIDPVYIDPAHTQSAAETPSAPETPSATAGSNVNMRLPPATVAAGCAFAAAAAAAVLPAAAFPAAAAADGEKYTARQCGGAPPVGHATSSC